ncbi:MAG: gliding motility lipoprotein GldD [Marinilabiliaceae bacterium]|nr:gliding motility lipoprotein GldD [Marinilabiliaceae bacterium]
MRKHNYINHLLILVFLLLATIACKKHYNPKPRGYFRITFPEKKYLKYDTLCPYLFEYPIYANINKDQNLQAEPYWINVNFPDFRGNIHISYKSITNNLYILEEDTRALAYKHTIKADAINEKLYYKPEQNVYGIYYEIKGDAASSIQFYLTDSVNHFLRGSLYFNVVPNKDSLAPVISFVGKDIQHLMETFEWKNLK